MPNAPLIHCSKSHYQYASGQAYPLALCVDDNPLVCRQLGKVMEQSGYRYRSFQDSIEALCAVIETKPNLIFVDLVMPHMGGYELCSRIRQISTLQATRIIILTNSERVVDRVRGKMAGADAYLTKPTTARKVLATVKQLEHEQTSL